MSHTDELSRPIFSLVHKDLERLLLRVAKLDVALERSGNSSIDARFVLKEAVDHLVIFGLVKDNSLASCADVCRKGRAQRRQRTNALEQDVAPSEIGCTLFCNKIRETCITSEGKDVNFSHIAIHQKL